MEKSAEQNARDLLERMGIQGAQRMTSGDVTELANLIYQNYLMGRALKKFIKEFQSWKSLNRESKKFEIAEMMDAHRMALEALDFNQRKTKKMDEKLLFKAFFNGIKQESVNEGRLNDIEKKFKDYPEFLKKQVRSEFEDFKKREKLVL